MLPNYTAGIRDLTEDQRKQIADIRSDTLKKIRQLEKQVNVEIKKLLSPEQVKAMEAAQRRVTHRGPDGVTLTDQQKAMMDAARAAVAKAESREERTKIMRDATEKVRASYTDQQKKDIEARRARFRRGRTRRRPPAGGGGDGQPRPE